MSFEGVCYDGPAEGEHIEQPSPWFRAPIYPPFPRRLHDRRGYMPADVTVAEYAWSRALRKWVWVQR